MNSPLTNKPMPLVIEKRRLKFRNDTFQISHKSFLFSESNQQYTCTELDEENCVQVYQAYAIKYNFSFPKEIATLINKYKSN
jgi:hypothetical protein